MPALLVSAEYCNGGAACLGGIRDGKRSVELSKGVSWQPKSGACAETAERLGCG